MELSGKRLAAALAAAFAAGLVAAAGVYAPLGIVSFKVLPGSSGPSGGSVYTVPFTVDLGDLAAGESGSFNGTASLSLPQGTQVKFELEHEDLLRRVFAEFTVTVSVGNYTFTLYLNGPHEYKAYLPAGDYTVAVSVDYTVKGSPDPGTYDSILFLKVEADHGHG